MPIEAVHLVVAVSGVAPLAVLLNDFAQDRNDFQVDKKKIRAELTLFGLIALSVFSIGALTEFFVPSDTWMYRSLVMLPSIAFGAVTFVYAIRWLIIWPLRGQQTLDRLFRETSVLD